MRKDESPGSIMPHLKELCFDIPPKQLEMEEEFLLLLFL